MRFLAGNRRVVSMSELVAKLESCTRIAPGTVVLTFDDGYLDNLQNAAPILRQYSLPATLYVPTGLVDRAEAQWIDRLYALVVGRTEDAVELENVGKFNLADPKQNLEFRRAARDVLLASDRPTRERTLEALRRCLQPSSVSPRLTMNWDEVREWARHPGLDVGVHTVEHIDLASCTNEVADAEIRGSMARAASELGRSPEHFSFPYGRSTPETRAMIRAAGLRSAVASGPDPRVRPGGPVNWIPRIAAPRSSTLFRFFTSAAYPDLPLRLIGRA
jgi:peptidoglycan/xylan/chitin deacetylase (PgdA/CDA1 family)